MSLTLAKMLAKTLTKTGATRGAIRSFSTEVAPAAKTSAARLVQPQNRALSDVPALPPLKADRFEGSKPVSAYLGPDPRKLHFKQGRISDCYVLSGLDAMLHHPQAKALFSRIQVEEVLPAKDELDRRYLVRFPAGRQVVLKGREIGAPQHDHIPVQGPRVIQMLELAYAKLVAPLRNMNPEFAPRPYPNFGYGHDLVLIDGGLPSEALGHMLVGDARAKFTRCYPNPKNLEKMVRHIATDTDHDYVISALIEEAGEHQRILELPARENGVPRKMKAFAPLHAYSIRSITPERVTVADVHNTATKVDDLTVEEFSKVFTGVDGIRFQKLLSNPKG